MILEMENGGIDVESFKFSSADQSLFAFLQVCYNKHLIFHLSKKYTFILITKNYYYAII